MLYRTMVKRVQDYSGFSDQESETALRLVVEIIAARLAAGERSDFASQLPMELKLMVLSMKNYPQRLSVDDIYNELGDLQNIDRGHAKKQVMAVWQTLEDAVSEGQIDHIRAQFPEELVEELH